MTTSRNHEATSEFVCQYEGRGRSACAGEPFYKAHEGKRYCVLHFPGKGKRREFARALQGRIENGVFDFRGFWFPSEAQFSGFEFDVPVDFTDVTFSAGADFSRAVFNPHVETPFGAAAQFSSTIFDSTATFEGATFNGGAFFDSSKFGAEANFDRVTFVAQVTFAGATFADRVRFTGREQHRLFGVVSSLNLEFTRIEKPEHFVFHTLELRPDWFVNVDSRKFQFINVGWKWSGNTPSLQETHRFSFIDDPFKSLRDWLLQFPNLPNSWSSLQNKLLAITYRQLALNAEDNHRYEEASSFRYEAMDSRRLEQWRGFNFFRLNWWYWAASGYGERIVRAAAMLIGVFLLFAVLYTQVGFMQWEPRLTSAGDVAVATRDEIGAPLKFRRALTYSAAVMTLQRPEPRPATITAQTIVLLETILGPVQAALLALAIRRKFMR